MSIGKYNIGVKISKGEELVYTLTVSSRCERLGKKKNINHFRMVFTLKEEGSIKILSNKLERANADWNISNYMDIGKGLFIFFLNTNQNCSDKWTEVWHIKNKQDLYYKMYDCGAKFIKLTAKHSSSL